MSIPERIIVSVAVKTRAEEENGWVLELEIPQFKSKYPTKVTRVPEAVAQLLAPRAAPYSIVLLRENLKKDKTGTQPYDYYWGLEGLATTAETATKASEPKPVDTRRMEIAWGQSINCAVARMGVGAVDDAYFTVMEQTANRFYPIILGGPEHDQDAPQATQGATPKPATVTFDSLGALYTAAIELGYPTMKSRMDVPGVQEAIEAKDYSRAYELLKAAKA